MDRRNFLVNILLWVMAFLFGYSVKKESDNLNILFKTGSAIDSDQDGREFMGNSGNSFEIQVPESNGRDDTDVIQSFLYLGKQKKRKVLLKPNQTYIVHRKGIKAIQDTVHKMKYGYSLIVPNGVTFDLNGSTIKLAANQDSLILVNEHPDATTDVESCIDKEIHIMNGVLDQNNAHQSNNYYQGGIYFSKVKNGSLYNLQVKNARLDGFRIMGLRNCNLDKLFAENIQGHGFYIGRNDKMDLRLYNCTIGILSAERCVSGYFNPADSNSIQTDGNSIHFMAVDTTIEALIDKNTDLGIKIAGGSNNLQISRIMCDGSPVKFQHKPNRIQIGLISVVNSPVWAVAFIDPANVQVGKINCYNCYTSDDPKGSVIVCAGTNVSIDDISLENCASGNSIHFKDEMDNYNIKMARLINSKGSIEVSANGFISFSELSIFRDAKQPGIYRGINVSNVSAILNISSLIISGNYLNDDYIVSQSKYLKIKSIIKDGINESGRIISLDDGSNSTLISGNAINYVYKTYGSITILPIIQFIPVSSASRDIIINGYKINPTTLDLTIYHTKATGSEKFIMNISEYTGGDVQFS